MRNFVKLFYAYILIYLCSVKENIDMTLFERLKLLAKKQGQSINDVEEKMGYSKNTLYRLRTTNPSAKKLQELADYFGVSTDYLLGRTDNPTLEKDKKDDVAALFRINTANMDPDTVEEIEEELKNYSEFLIQKALEKKARRNKK